MALLNSDGLVPREALGRFLEAVGDRDLYSDEPDFDAYWLGMLADAAGLAPNAAKIPGVKGLADQIGLTLEFVEPPRHRAEQDARRLATALLGR